MNKTKQAVEIAGIAGALFALSANASPTLTKFTSVDGDQAKTVLITPDKMQIVSRTACFHRARFLCN